MIHRRRYWLLSLLLLGAGWLGLRACAVARLPGFAPRIELRRLPSWESRGLELLNETPAGAIRTRARRVRPGHQTVGFFKFGPSTFLDLEDVTLERSGPDDIRWRVIGRRARFRGQALVFRGRATVYRPGASPERREGVVVDLDTGAITVEE
jgi:hypothetical protein